MKAACLAVMTFFSAVASAGDWYNDVAPSMGLVELSASGAILLKRASGTAVVVGAAGSCSVNVVQLTAPIGKEKEWLAMVLAATLVGRPINVFGDCDQANSLITANRLVVAYQ